MRGAGRAGRPRPGRALACTLAAAAAALAAGAGAARAGNVCATLGLAGAAVRAREAIVSELPDEDGTPVCRLTTRTGTAYAAVYPERLGTPLRTSWEFGLVVHTEPLPRLGRAAACYYTAGYGEEALGFTTAAHFVWITTAGRYMHAELLALAAAVGAGLR